MSDYRKRVEAFPNAYDGQDRAMVGGIRFMSVFLNDTLPDGLN